MCSANCELNVIVYRHDAKRTRVNVDSDRLIFQTEQKHSESIHCREG